MISEFIFHFSFLFDEVIYYKSFFSCQTINLFTHVSIFFFVHSNPIPNHSSIIETIPSALTSSALVTSTTPNKSDVVVGATLVDKINEGVDKIAQNVLSPYFGKKDLVDSIDPSPYFYLPPQPQSY